MYDIIKLLTNHYQNFLKHYDKNNVSIYNNRNKIILKYARTTMKSMCVSIKGCKLLSGLRR